MSEIAEFRLQIAKCAREAVKLLSSDAERLKRLEGKEVSTSSDHDAIRTIFFRSVIPYAVAIRDGTEEQVMSCRTDIERDISWLKRKSLSAHPEMKSVYEIALREVQAARLIAESKDPISREDALENLGRGM